MTVKTKPTRPPLPDTMVSTFGGALYRACPYCGAATREAGLVTERCLAMPHGHEWRQRCVPCGRNLGNERDIAKAVAA